MSYGDFFEAATGFSPRPWQARLGDEPTCRDRLVPIPTGMGKTIGVATAWLYHRVQRDDPTWPTRLVWVLPMRTLVEQTLAALRSLREKSGLPFEITPCMGGLVDKEYAVHPETPTILVGTQDMLVSRMLNRGYAAARGRWPVDFGLLSRDVLVVCDEVQLMGEALPTTAQLAAFRRRSPAVRPSYTWWMSATLQEDWLRTVDFAPRVDDLVSHSLAVPVAEQTSGIWNTQKPLTRRTDLDDEGALATAVREAHRPGTLTLVIVNRVDRAVTLHKKLAKGDAELRLVHSRFRPAEREDWLTTFLSRGAPVPDAGRIIVATQVVEAGVDISASTLFTDLAPWPSLVQRFGRAARYEGESAQIVVAGSVPPDDRKSAPYSQRELAAADRALQEISGVSLAELQAFERGLSAATRAELYPPVESAVLRECDLLDLFDTTADLSGADLDIAPFVRVRDARDISVFWRAVEGPTPPDKTLPAREELCSAPIGAARKWLDKLESSDWWVLDFGTGWKPGSASGARRLAPGQVVLVRASAGGYDPDIGWAPKSKEAVSPVVVHSAASRFETSAAIEGADTLSENERWRTILTHCTEAAEHVFQLATRLGVPRRTAELVSLAARWHDIGKAHPVFQACITENCRSTLADPDRPDLAKAPPKGWTRAKRRGFRHELASALGLLELLRRTDPDHPALRGSVGAMLDALDLHPTRSPPDLVDHPLGQELRDLSAAEIDLVLWLVATHHGKVRSALVSTPNDQRDMRRMPADQVQIQIHGVREGDTLPAIQVPGPSGPTTLPSLDLPVAVSQVGLDPDFGRSWTERAQSLLNTHGPFELAWLEALVRAADVQASQLTTPDPEVTP